MNKNIDMLVYLSNKINEIIDSINSHEKIPQITDRESKSEVCSHCGYILFHHHSMRGYVKHIKGECCKFHGECNHWEGEA